MINNDALKDLADYLDEGNLHSPFNMSCYSDCAVGQYIRREAQKDGRTLKEHEVATEAMHAVRHVFGIESGSTEWNFVFGSEWGNMAYHDRLNHVGGAAKRLRELATTGTTPPANKWAEFETS